MITLDQLVPENHLVRKIEASIDFSFIYDLIIILGEYSSPLRANVSFYGYVEEIRVKIRLITIANGEHLFDKNSKHLIV
ncbi:hypothetical protein CN925_09105 [Bacillus sp. AFS055030]|nr:hypothetical protein CN925_09105 [Bacillus sp. AFS055030]